MHKCEKCNLTFTLRGSLQIHIKRHHEGQKFYCSQCPKQFVSKETLIRHEKTHTGIREFQCEKCLKSFYTAKELRKHQRYHQVSIQIKNNTFNIYCGIMINLIFQGVYQSLNLFFALVNLDNLENSPIVFAFLKI